MSKIQLSINTGQIDSEMVKQIEEEVEGYSLTPRNKEERLLKVIKQNLEANFVETEYNLKELILPVEEKISGVLHTNLNEAKKKDLVTELLKEAFVQTICDINKINSYVRDFNNLIKSIDISQNPYYFASKCNEIVRHGINIHSTKKIADAFNDTILKLKKGYGVGIDNLPEDTKSSKSGGSKQKLALDDNSCKILHPLEIILFKEAIDNVLKESHKAILVDIFERTKDGRIAIDEERKEPKIHTVVLCKKVAGGNNDDLCFLVIDPSNSEFSQHLGMFGVNKIISSLLEQDIRLEVSNKSYKIYEQNSKIGTGLAINKFRDCIDIAFKLAKDFNTIPDQSISFNTQDKTVGIFMEQSANNIVKRITNNRDLDNNIEESLCDTRFLNYPFRGKQLTNKEIGKDFYEKQVNVYKKISEHVKNLPLNLLNKTQVIEDMRNTFNNSMNTEKGESFLEKVNNTIPLIHKINEVFISGEPETEMELLGDTFVQVTGEICKYYQ